MPGFTLAEVVVYFFEDELNLGFRRRGGMGHFAGGVSPINDQNTTIWNSIGIFYDIKVSDS